MLTRQTLREASEPVTPPHRLEELAQEKSLLIRRRLAQNQSTPTKILGQLLWPYDRRVRQSLAKNPSIPSELLEPLATEYPEEILENPSLPLHLLEDVNLLERGSLRSLLLRAKSAPADMLSAAAQHQDQECRLQAARHTNTPPERLAALLFDRDEEVRLAAQQNPNTPRQAFDEIEHWKSAALIEKDWEHASQNAYLASLIAQNKNLPDDRVMTLLQRDDGALWHRYPSLSLEQRNAFTQGGWLKIQKAILQRERLPEKAFELPSNHFLYELMSLWVAHPLMTQETIRRIYKEQHLLEKPSIGWTYALARSPNTPEDILVELIMGHHIADHVDVWMDAHQPAPEEVLLELMTGVSSLRQNNIARYVAAANQPNAPRWLVDLYRRAGFDATQGVMLRPAPEISPEDEAQLFSLGIFPQKLLARNPHTSEGMLHKIVQKTSKSREILLSIARNPRASQEILAELSQNKDWRAILFGSCAANPSTLISLWQNWYCEPPKSEEEVFPIMCNNRQVHLREMAARNIHLPKELRAKLLNDQNAQVREAICERDDLSQRELIRLLRDQDASVRRAASNHPKAPKALLDFLHRCGASKDLMGFSTPDLSVTSEDLAALAKRSAYEKMLAARHPGTPAHALHELVSCPNEIATLAVCHSNTAPETLCQVAERPNRLLQLAMLKRSQPIPEEILFLLCGDRRLELRQAASKRAEASSVRELFVRAGATEDLLGFGAFDHTLDASILSRFTHGDVYAQQLAARHPNTTPRDLSRLAGSQHESVRAFAAMNPNTPNTTLHTLRRAGASQDLTEIEPPDEDLSEEERREAQSLGPFGALIAKLAARHKELSGNAAIDQQ